MQWDFWSQVPEALHQITILFSDRGTPKGIPYMHGFGSHTYSFINAKNERFWVKFHFKTQQGIQNMLPTDADRLAGQDPDYHTRQLFEAIQRGEYPKWKFSVQVMPEAEAENYRWNPFDLTKVWPHADYPLIEVGIMEMNRNPQNYYAEVEQAAFSPANVVPGISFSPCKMLQARIFAYADAHRYGWVSILKNCRSIHRIRPVLTTINAMVKCALMIMAAPHRIMNRIILADQRKITHLMNPH